MSEKIKERKGPECIILSLDIGSSGVRCLPYLLNAGTPPTPPISVLEGCSSYRKTRIVEPGTGTIIGLAKGPEELDLLGRVDGCVSKTLGLLRERYGSRGFMCAGVGFSTFVMNLVGVDKSGSIVVGEDGKSASITYACNSIQVAAECRRLRSELGQERLSRMYIRVGAPLHSAYALPQLRTFYADPQNFPVASRVSQWQSLAGLCLQRWLGCKNKFLPLSYSEASWTGLLNFRTCQWDSECLGLLTEECRNALPTLSDFCDQEALEGGMSKLIGEEGNPYWEKWPELRQSRFFLGIGDGAAANIGSKCTSGSNRIATTIGTSAASRFVLPLPIEATSSSTQQNLPPQGLFCYRIDANQILIGGALTDGGSAVEWVRSLLNLNIESDFNHCMKDTSEQYKKKTQGDVAVSSTACLTVVPFLSGERSVGFRDGAKGCALGFTRDTTSTDLLESVLVGVTLRVCAVLKLLQTVSSDVIRSEAGLVRNARDPCIVASGAALEKNGLWRQMLADASGLPVFCDADASDGTGRGVALLVRGAMSKDETEDECFISDGEDLVPSVREDPREFARAYWSAQAEAQDNAINAVSPLWSS